MEDNGSVEFAAAKVHQYRFAMTAKDCSLMVTLVSSEEEEEDDEDLPPQRHVCRPHPFSSSVSILDLDPKPFDSISRQLRLDQKIVSCYLKTSGALPKGALPLLSNRITATERDDCRLLFHPWSQRSKVRADQRKVLIWCCSPDAISDFLLFVTRNQPTMTQLTKVSFSGYTWFLSALSNPCDRCQPIRSAAEFVWTVATGTNR
uniref:Inositol-pentakisphosphate 2-kinase n=1 Tax=Nothobranchius kuhntae TaxID=321403 RepID=A0A1A8HQB1_NOTKU